MECRIVRGKGAVLSVIVMLSGLAGCRDEGGVPRGMPRGMPRAMERAMQRAVESYAPDFQPFAASEYAAGVDTTSSARGDFNGDGVADVALYGHDDARELLFVVLSAPGARFNVVPLEEKPLAPFQNGAYIYLKTHPAGPLEIPAGLKALLDTVPPERLEYDAIDVGYGNEAGVLYYWNGQRFVKVVTGD
jgi:hypothetical protein